MDDLEVCKAIADLEGVNADLVNGELFIFEEDGVLGPEVPVGYFDPITDLALNCMLRDKYEVNIEYCTQFDCGIDGNGDFDIPYVTASIKDPKGAHSMTPLNDCSSSSICRAVCECILKSVGKYG